MGRLILSSLLITCCLQSFSQKGKLIEAIETVMPISCIEISPNNELIAVSDDTKDPLGFQELVEEFSITIYDSRDFSVVTRFRGHDDAIQSIDFSPDSRKLVSSDNGGNVMVWDISSSAPFLTIPTNDWVHSVKFSSSGNELVAIQGYEKRALIFDLQGHLIAELPAQKQVNDLEINFDKTEVYLGCHDEIQVWSLLTRSITKRIPFTGLMCMTLNHDNSQLGIGLSSGNIVILTTELEEQIKLSGHFKPVLSVDFSFEDSELISGSSDQTIRIWNLDNQQEIVQLVNEHAGNVQAVRFISNNNFYATGGENLTLKIWK